MRLTFVADRGPLLERQAAIRDRLAQFGIPVTDEGPAPPRGPTGPPGAPQTVSPLRSELEYNTRPERLDHTFADKHKLDEVVAQVGSREKAVELMLDGLRGRVPEHGAFEEVITVGGEQVTIRGFVDNGVIKIGTAFIR